MAVRGYDCGGVDTFLATLRSDIADLQERHSAATARIAELESEGGVEQATSGTEGELRRTLILAQRLADETEAEAKAAAQEMATAAAQHAEETRAAADADAASKGEAANEELAAAQQEAAALREDAATSAEREKDEARRQARSLLEAAESTGTERVIEIERLAQDEVANMREPVREEVAQLEGVRASLLGDISDLEAHLEAQRVRVRTAVEALRAGMSGSIEDLERVAENDMLIAPEPAPDHSTVTGADVQSAPDIAIQEVVGLHASETTPTVAALEDQVQDEAVPVEAVQEQDQKEEQEGTVEVEPEEVGALDQAGSATQPIPVVDASEHVEPIPDESVLDANDGVTEASDVTGDTDPADDKAPFNIDDVADDDTVSMPEVVVEEAASAQSVTQDAGAESSTVQELGSVEVPTEIKDPSAGARSGGFVALGGAAVAGAVVHGASNAGDAEAIDLEATQAMEVVSDLDEGEVVLLDEEPDALFGTDLGAEADVDDALLDTASQDEASMTPADIATGSNDFVAAIAEALDQLPIEPR